MSKAKNKPIIKSYELVQKANPIKEKLLFDLYQVYKIEYKTHVHNYWSLFLKNKTVNNKFSHFGSTKHIQTQLNSGLLQSLLNQSCATLNNYLANISTKFNQIISKSSIKDKDLLHKLRTINSTHSWLNNEIYYYPTRIVVDNYGNEVEVKHKVLIDFNSIRLARLIFNHVIKDRVRFPNLEKPRFIIDDRLYSLEPSKSQSFDYWLNIITLEKGKRISIPILANDYFNEAKGYIGKSIELNFNEYNYSIEKHKHNSLSKKHNKTSKVNKEIKFIFNKKYEFNPETLDISMLNKTVSFDLGLCNLIATSDGELFGQYWLYKLTQFDKKITELFSARQSCISKFNNQNKGKLSIRSKKYDSLIKQVKGFIKTELNRIINRYFEKNTNIKTVIIENLNFSSPELSRRLNRIIQNFGLNIFKNKLEELSKLNGFKVVELNPAYTSQECANCGYVDKSNRLTQSQFKCKCCNKELNADIQGSRVNFKRFESKQNSTYKSLGKSIILRKLKVDFSHKIQSLISNGTISRRNLFNLIKSNNYFKSDLIEIVSTTEAQGLEPMTTCNFDKCLVKYYSGCSKI